MDPFLTGSLISAGSGLLGGLLGGKKKYQEPQITKLPDYAESDAARGEWWKRLQGWGADENYGAISPDWANIWQNAENKVRNYFHGSPTTSGLVNKVKASAARRGVAGGPALEKSLTRLAAEEGQQMSNLATEQATKQAEFGENARLNWMNSLTGLSQLKPAYNVNNNPTPVSGFGNLIGNIGGGIGNAMSQYGTMKWMEDLIKPKSSSLNSFGTPVQPQGTYRGNIGPMNNVGNWIFAGR